MPYNAVEPNPDFVKLEEETLQFWEESQTFQRSVSQRPARGENGENNEFVFYDGPPFANGMPHYGHLLTGYVKDAFARYQTMKGKRVERRFGWDCHGLPAEMGAEKELNISGRNAIMEYGIEKFNDHCRKSVMKYRDEWRYYVTRQARWVDFDNDYKTMDTDYMESVIWAFKQLYNKGLVYESYRVMPYSWAAETPVSNFETKLDNAYREREDKAVTVAFELNEKPEFVSHLWPEATECYVSAWTTTPWTLPSNLALAIHPSAFLYEAKYDPETGKVLIQICNGEPFTWGQYQGALQDDCIEELRNTMTAEGVNQLCFMGDQLLGLTYKPLFPYFKNQPDAFRILDGSSFIEEGSGTGIVHMAPAFGEDDQRVCQENGIELVCPVNEKGRYTDEIFDIPAMPEATPYGDDGYETDRCYLRPFTSEDEDLFISLHTNKDVMDTVNDGVRTEQEAKQDLADTVARQKKYGFDQFAVFHKESGAFIGRAGLSMIVQRADGDAEDIKPVLRAALLPDFWRGGYGTELCRFVTMLGFMKWGYDEVIAGALENNPPSHRMIERIGFTEVDTVMYKRMMGPFFTCSKQDFIAAHTPLSLEGLNVVAETESAYDDEPYTPDQMAKYGLANLRIINWLKTTGKLIKQENYLHNYPHCWRTDTPLIYRALSSWYVKVTEVKDRMGELNKNINWVPNHIRDGAMGHMLNTAPDWSVSRNRFWGTPVPIWKSDNPENDELYVFGSVAELEEFFGAEVVDLHRPHIDNLTKPDPTNPEYTISRVEEVFDCWFESGSMPYAQVHYPFENKDWFDTHFPAQFITEYIGQTRGWFNTLISLSTALFDTNPFENCVCHGVVLDAETGLKYSKRLKNYKDPKEVFDSYGADALRWMMLSSPVMRGADIGVDPEGAFIRDVVRLYIKPFWSAYNFFILYANADGLEGSPVTTSENTLDRYILAKLKQTVSTIDGALNAYDTPTACTASASFFELLNNWYIRRSRERFWASEKTADKQCAYDTLYTVLHHIAAALAPLLPCVSEAVYRGLTGGEAGKSVHLLDFPDVSAISDDAELVADMDRVRDACNTILSIRNDTNIRIRQPLASATLYGAGASRLKPFEQMIADEVNVKTVHFSDDLEAVAEQRLTVNFKVAGKRLGAKMKAIGGAAKQGDWSLDNGEMTVGGEALLAEEYTLALIAKDGLKGAQALASNDAIVALDTTITDELAQEGLARDVVRAVQQARKDADLNVTDRIIFYAKGDEATLNAIRHFGDYIAEQTLCDLIDIKDDAPSSAYVSETKMGDGALTLAIHKAAKVAS